MRSWAVPRSFLPLLTNLLMIQWLARSVRFASGFVRCRRITSSAPFCAFAKRVYPSHLDEDNGTSTDHHIVHLNHAGASPSPSCVLDRVIQHMQLEQKLGGYAAARTIQDELRHTYQTVARLIHAGSPTEIALVESATVAWTRLFYSMAAYQDHAKTKLGNRRKVILVSEAEYAANVVACCQWAKDHSGWTVMPIPSSKDQDTGRSTGIIDLVAFQDMLLGRDARMDPAQIAMVCVTHVPTNAGIVNPVTQIGSMIEAYNQQARSATTTGEGPFLPSILYLVDACQSVGQFHVNVVTMKCHGLTATGRKYLRAPRGTGFLYVPRNVCEQLAPSHIDHYSAPVLSVPTSCTDDDQGLEHRVQYDFREGASRFEFWESSVANKLGLGKAVRYAMDEIGLDHIAHTCSELASQLRSRLQTMESVNIHHADSSCGIVTFSLAGVSAEKAQALLWRTDGTCLRFDTSVVPATSTPMDSARGPIPNLLRASVSYTNTLHEIEAFSERLNDIIGNAT